MRTPENILTDSIFLMAFAQDLMIQDLILRLKSQGDGLRQRSKFNLNEMIKALKRASHFADELKEELFEADSEHKWKNIQTWQDEANEVPRLVLLWEDREPHPDECDKIFKFIRQNTEGDGVVDDRVLSNYYLQKSCPPSTCRKWVRVAGGNVKAKRNWGYCYFEVTGTPLEMGMFLPHFEGHLAFVHELQHALRLCGIKKEIEL